MATTYDSSAPSSTSRKTAQVLEEAEIYLPPATNATAGPDGRTSPASERYRLVALRLAARFFDGSPRLLVVTSPWQGDGKTTTAIHLGTVLARELGRRVALVDGDLRRPRLGSAMGLMATRGLGDVLREGTKLDEILWRVGNDELYVVPGCPAQARSGGVLAAPPSRGMPAALEALRARHDWVLVDAPAVHGCSDAMAYARQADGVLLVVRSGHTPRAEVAAALEALDGAPLVGIVVNDHRGPEDPLVREDGHIGRGSPRRGLAGRKDDGEGI